MARKANAEVNSPVQDRWQEANQPSVADRPSAIEAWKQTVAVQMHFNDICMKLRNIAITMLAAVIGLAAYSVKERIEVDVFGFQVPIGVFIAGGGFVGWVAFYAMDVHWYHIFLRAAGIHAARIEDRWRRELPELMLSSQIAESSSRVIWGLKFHSVNRLSSFYLIGAVVIFVTGFAVWRAHPPADRIAETTGTSAQTRSAAAAGTATQAQAPLAVPPSLSAPTPTSGPELRANPRPSAPAAASTEQR